MSNIFSETITKVGAAITNKLNAAISAHDSSSSAHSTEMAKKISKTSNNTNLLLADGTNIPQSTFNNYTHPTELSSALSTKSLYQIKANTKGHITEATSISIDSTSGGTNNNTNLITSGAVYSGLSGKENTNNKVINWSSTTTDAHYPSEKLVKDNLDKIVQMIGDAFDINEATINVMWEGNGTKPEAIEVSLADSNENNILMIQTGENTYQQVNYPWLITNNHWTGAAIMVMGNDINVTSTDVTDYPNKTITIDEDYNINITYSSIKGPKVPEEYDTPL